MVQKYNLPETEAQLKELLDSFYTTSKENIVNKQKQSFKGLMEIIKSDVVITTAIHTIKSNHGSQTKGSDGMVMEDILSRGYDEILDMVKRNMEMYNPSEVRRVWIDKPGKKEKRPLGIPTITDRIIQECVKIVIEPILEAQFFAHSYGFRPMRDTHMALKRITSVIHLTKHMWVVEGDISKFFDNVNHTILVKKLWNMGIHDRRVLMIIRQMLKAGIMNEKTVNDLGTPQGGIISPLLANVYLHSLDMWVAREWEEKQTKTSYCRKEKKFDRLRKASKLKPAYFIRYADDWVLITNTKENAEKWKYRIAKYLEETLKLKLSEEKTLITNCTERYINFVGFKVKAIKRMEKPKGQKDNPKAERTRMTLITKVAPQDEKFESKVKEINRQIHKLKRMPNRDDAIHQVNLINSQIRGIINYYRPATNITIVTKKYSSQLQILAYRCLRRHGVELVKTEKLKNLLSVHKDYKQTVPALNVNKDEKQEPVYIGVTNLSFTKWKEPQSKNQNETPYTDEGRKMYAKRMEKKSPLSRADEYFSLKTSYIISKGMRSAKYNFEYYMNRGYTINRDKFKCRVCNKGLTPNNAEIHHKNPLLPLWEINKVQRLVSVCSECHRKIHDNNDYSEEKTWKNINKLRKELEVTI